MEHDDDMVANSVAAQRRFVGTRVRNTAREKLTYWLVLAGFVLFCAIHFPPLATMPIIRTANSALGAVGGAAVFVAVGVLATVIIFRIGGKKLVLSVTAGGVTVDSSPGEVFALRDAQLGHWTRRTSPAGRALILTSGPHRYVLGATDGRVTGEVPTGGPEVKGKHLDAWLSPQPFDELLAIAGLHSELPPQARRSAPWVLRGVLLFAFVVALGFPMQSMFSCIYQYALGTPTTATVSQSAAKSICTHHIWCTGTWTVNGQIQSGPILTQQTVAGSTLSVHVRDGKAIAANLMPEQYRLCGVWAAFLIASCVMIIYGIRTRRSWASTWGG
jgi:hypothetical protein